MANSLKNEGVLMEGQIQNQLRKLRVTRGFSQGELAEGVGLTRQGLYAIEQKHYLPSTEISLKLAQALGCTVEDIFSLPEQGEIMQAELVAGLPLPKTNVRAKVAWVGKHPVAMPMPSLGDYQHYALAADGVILGVNAEKVPKASKYSVSVQLWKSPKDIKEQIVVAGCDPAIFLIEAHLHASFLNSTIVGRTMGSLSAIQALQRGKVHIAGIHVVDPMSGEFNRPFMKKYLKGGSYTVVRFAGWEQGLMVKSGNPKRIRTVSDLVKKGVRCVNREPGAGARLLLDRLLKKEGIPAQKIHGYQSVAHSHLDVARVIAEEQVEVGIGVRAAARWHDLDFIPLQEERYDFVIPSQFLKTHPRISQFLDAIVSRPFRMEMEALGGYDTRETGNIIE
jgi:molybdate-binding protein/DNA-binding XRE family transcriptional regulator